MRVKYALAVSLLLICPILLFPLDIIFNGNTRGIYNNQRLKDLAYLLPTVEGETTAGLALQEILPILSEAYRMDIETASSVYRIDDGELAEKLSGSYLLADGIGWDLRFGKFRYQDVSRISLWGESLTDRDLEVWISWEGTRALKEEIERFSGLHDLDIKVVDVPKTVSKLIAVLRGGGELPDVVMIQSDNVPNLSRAKAIQSLDYLLVPDLVSKGFDAFRWNDRLWAVPFIFDSQLLFYNPDLVETIKGVVIKPGRRDNSEAERWTLEDLEDAAEMLREVEDVVPMAWNVYSAYWLVSFQMGFGKKRLIEPDGGIRIDDKPTTHSLQYLLRLIEEGLLVPMERDAMVSTFVTGRTGFILTGSYSIPHFQDLGIPFDVLRYPEHPTTGDPVSPLLDFKGFAITRKSRHPILARRLIQYLTGPGVQQRFCVSLSKMPALKTVWPIMQKQNRFYSALISSYAIGTVVPPAPAYTVFKNTMWKILRFVFSAQMTVSKALAQGQDIIDVQLSDEY